MARDCIIPRSGASIRAAMIANRLAKPLYLIVAWFSVALGLVGIAIPVLPTTPFLLVAVWAFSRSSPELAEKIRNHPHAGPYIRDWQDHGVIPLRAKILATLMMSGASLYLFRWSHAPYWLSAAISAGMVLVAIYIWSRPSSWLAP